MSAPGVPIGQAEAMVLAALRGLRFGVLEVVVHDGRVVRVERTEKLRLEAHPEEGGSGAEEEPTTGDRPDRRRQSESMGREIR